MQCILPKLVSVVQIKQHQVDVSIFTHLWYFGRRPTHHLLLQHFLLNENTGHIQGAQEGVGLESQGVSLRWEQLQGVHCWVQMEMATQLHQEVHQRLTGMVRKREEGGREKVKGREG